MAIIKAVDHPGKSLAQIIRYVTKPEKTEAALISGWNLIDAKQARQEMMATKKLWGKTGGRQYKHFVQSFRADDGVTPKDAHHIAAEVVAASTMFAEYEVLIATHVDRDHIHTHIICNSVSIMDGHKFRYAKPELEDLKELSDTIVKQHGYRLEQEREETENVTGWRQEQYQLLEAANAGRKHSWVYDTAVKVLEAAEQTSEKDSFIRYMETAGYGIRWGSQSITFTTPDGCRIRAAQLEKVFKLPSLISKYGDRKSQQELLRSELERAEQRQTVPAAAETDWSRFNLDLKTDASPKGSSSQEAQRYAAACAVCRQLRAADSPASFIQGMASGGYQVRYAPNAKNVVFITPGGLHIRSSLLEERYGLPSIRGALEETAGRAAKIPAYDGELWPQLRERHGSRQGPVYSGHDAIISRHSMLPPDRMVRISGWTDENSSMWQYELDAAAIALGIGMQLNGSMQEWLEINGYELYTPVGDAWIMTPRKRRLRIRMETEPVPEAAFREDPYKCTFFFLGEAFWMLERARTDEERMAAAVVSIVALAAAIGALIIETAALLVRGGIDVATRGTDKSLVLEVPPAQPQMILRPEGKDAIVRQMTTPDAAAEMPEKSVTAREELRPLLKAVQSAAQADDKAEFIRRLYDQGYEVRWTKNGTVTFLQPDGKHVRASRLETIYHLPPIAAAYGQERHVLQKGPRPAAALAIRKAMEISSGKDEFDAAMAKAGYQVKWKTEQAEAVITAPTGEHMRLSSLEQAFDLPSARERYFGIQHKEAIAGERNGADGLRAALASAAGRDSTADNGARAAAAIRKRRSEKKKQADRAAREDQFRAEISRETDWEWER